jgi:hypothetical protein
MGRGVGTKGKNSQIGSARAAPVNPSPKAARKKKYRVTPKTGTPEW